MDWDSPTTKKHIAEAEAQCCELLGKGRSVGSRMYRLQCGHKQMVETGKIRAGAFRCRTCLKIKLKQESEARGCELLGAAKDSKYRLYQLPCGHEQEVNTGRMREGEFACQTCHLEKLTTEAKSHGSKLIGPGKTRFYRIYRLPCGHEQEVGTAHMRAGNVRCQVCHLKKLTAEAKARGSKLLGPGKDFNYRLYQLPCGHKQEINVARVRDGVFSCQTCTLEKQTAEAKSRGCELLGSGRQKDYQIYQLPCGHEQEISAGNMRSGNFRCQVCMLEKLTEEADVQSCKLLRPGRSANRRIYRLPCGHEQEILTPQLRDGTFRCQICMLEKLTKEAKAHDCELLGSGKDKDYRIYRLPCGHEQEILTPHMRIGSFRCQICEDWAFTQPSQTYLLHIKVGPDEWLKLGFAKNIELRVSQYGLPSDAVISTLKTKQFDTGKEAQKFEQLLHKRHKRKRLKSSDMTDFHTKSGQTECYPLTLVHQLLAEFRS